jgi:hypothetical protein
MMLMIWTLFVIMKRLKRKLDLVKQEVLECTIGIEKQESC